MEKASNHLNSKQTEHSKTYSIIRCPNILSYNKNNLGKKIKELEVKQKDWPGKVHRRGPWHLSLLPWQNQMDCQSHQDLAQEHRAVWWPGWSNDVLPPTIAALGCRTGTLSQRNQAWWVIRLIMKRSKRIIWIIWKSFINGCFSIFISFF